MPSSPKFNELLEIGRRYQIPDPREAFGRCFAATLEFAAFAEGQGHSFQLIRWQVSNDPAFCDHWAILTQENAVIDLTRVQVDGNAELVHSVAAYPQNYREPRCYPPSLLLQHFERLPEIRPGHLPFWFMWDCGISLLRYDIHTAYKSRHWRELVLGLVEALKFATRSTWLGMHYHLVREKQTKLGHNTIG